MATALRLRRTSPGAPRRRAELATLTLAAALLLLFLFLLLLPLHTLAHFLLFVPSLEKLFDYRRR